ncbi:hypothetical protein LTR36_003498 [Oleoguttula mirabilis]|uniref:Endosome-associated-trafficking regulator 1 n=1 Tax=Oleoguttula mirabilis TaxID=1507867 RepID=A0AAV9JJ67_9PEZI|nr:hypothetical protein LTR36_003498 [Oleoguttula mirabilis]
MSVSHSGDSDQSPSITSKKRATTGSRKSERLSKQHKVTDDMDDWQAAEVLLNDMSSRSDSLRAEHQLKAVCAEQSVQTIARLVKENEELKRLARERQEKIGPLQMNLEVAEEEAEIVKKRTAELVTETKAASSVIQAKLLQVAELEKAIRGLTSKVAEQKVEIGGLQKQHRDGHATTLKVVEAAQSVKNGSLGITGLTMGQFGSALDGLREALQAREESISDTT